MKSIFKINPVTYFLLLSILLCGYFNYFVVIFVILFFHEIGHMMMIKLFKNYLFVYRFIVLRLMQSYIFFRNQTTFATILPQISLCLGGVSHRFHGIHRNSCWVYSPTEYAELTEFTAEYSPTDFRCNFRGCTCLKCTNQANSDDLPQIAQIYTDG